MTAVGGRLRLDIDSVDDDSSAYYKYIIGSGDFDIQIDVPTYVADDATYGLYWLLRINNVLLGKVVSDPGNHQIAIRYNRSDGDHLVFANTYIDGSYSSYGPFEPASYPSTWRIVRDGNDIKVYYYISSWVLMGTYDYGVYASELKYIYIIIADRTNNGGYVEFDNLIFVKGCPDGYPKVWTTTSSTTTTTTTV